MKILDLCGPHVVTVLPDSTLQEAAELMDARGVGCVVVTDGTYRPVGVLTDRDIVSKAVAKNLSASSEKVADHMSTEIVAVSHNAEVTEAVQLMHDKQVRRVLILGDENKICGIISTDDLVRLMGQEMRLLGELFRDQSGPNERRRAHDFTRMA